MNCKQIEALQKLHGYSEMQEMINSGDAWKMEGSVGREASALLGSGACMLPKVHKYDAYGNRVPSRDDLKPGTKGTFKNSQRFWTDVENGKIELYVDSFEDMES